MTTTVLGTVPGSLSPRSARDTSARDLRVDHQDPELESADPIGQDLIQQARSISAGRGLSLRHRESDTIMHHAPSTKHGAALPLHHLPHRNRSISFPLSV